MLSLAVLAAAKEAKVECATDGAKAVDQATDAAIYIWAATKRCGGSYPGSPKVKDEKVKCAMDITSSITAVGNVANIIAAALDECGIIKTTDKGCGLLAGQLTTAIAALASDTAGMLDACKPNKFEGHAADNLAAIKLNSDTDLGMCLIDAKGSLASMFAAIGSLKKLQKGDVEHNALETVSALASLGQGVAAAVNDCSAFKGKGNQNAVCASRTLGAVAELHRIADLAESMASTCKASASRLYLENSIHGRTLGVITKNSMSLTLAAFLPVAAVLGFVFGRRFSKAGANRDFETMIQGENE